MSTEPADVVDAQPAQSTAVAAPQQRRAVAVQSPADLMKIAVREGANIDQLERLMAMQIAWESHEARKAFVVAMSAFKAEPLTIYKRKLVEFTTRDGDTTSYKHAELSDVTDALVPAMAKHGLLHRWDVKQEGSRISVSCILTHSLGHSETVTMEGQPDASGKKNAIQQVASTVQYLQRYTLLAATGMSTTGGHPDDDARGGGDADDVIEVDPWIDAARSASLSGNERLKQWFGGAQTASENDGMAPRFDRWWAANRKSLRDAADAADADARERAKERSA